jgi:hypothetical protein
MRRTGPRRFSQLMAALVLIFGAALAATSVRAQRLFGRGGWRGGPGLSGSRVPRRPRLPFMPPRAAAAEPEQSTPATH